MKIMKKVTLLFFAFLSFTGFSQQDAKQIIQSYLNTNSQKLKLSNQDVSDWYVQSEGSSDVTNINNYYVMQRYQGIDIFRSNTNFSVKNGEVLNVGNRFVSNLSSKTNTVTPALSVTDALAKAYAILNLSVATSFSILEKTATNSYKINNSLSVDNPVTAELVFQQTKDKVLKLAWNFTIDVPGHDHMWSVRIDAVDGKLLEKNDLVISCSFDREKKTTEKFVENKFTSDFYKNDNSFAPTQTLGGSYRVIPFNYESPNHSPFVLVANPENALASPNGWHNASAAIGGSTTTYTITRGNNVWAKDDFLSTNSLTGTSPDGTSSLLFDFPYGGTGVASSTYISAANTNLFYMNNISHDVWYQYGFNEANGNFQASNLGRYGAGANDFVFADAQDAGSNTATTSNRNNANFATPTDAGIAGTSNPRMQMYLWSYAKRYKLLTVTSPAAIATDYYANQNAFSPGHVDLPAAPAAIQSDAVLYLDSGATTSFACGLPTNAAAMAGKIVIIRRGTCTFAIKVKAAQTAGASAVIIVNNTTGTINMSGADATITIPAVSVTQADGEAIITQLQTSPVNIKLQLPLDYAVFVNTDGDFDNGIIAHEYGHGISTRLAGGRLNSSCLQNQEQMGEGWSDWFALMLLLKSGDVGTTPKEIGTFATSQPITGKGIRNYPYTTDMALNPETFNTVNLNQYTDSSGNLVTEVHNVGEVWTTMLWDLTWAYIAKYGYDDNKYTGTGGNNKLMRLVLDAIKLQPCSPSFVDARNAIIAADQATTGGADFCMIWKVFARRGLGVNASSGDTDISIDEVEDYTEPAAGPNCTNLATNSFGINNSDVKIYPNPTNGQFNIKINQFVGKVNIQVVDLNGRLILDIKDDNFNIEKTIDLSAFQSGIYLVKVTSDEANFTQKIIKN